MKKQTPEEKMARLEEALNQTKSELKKYKQRDKYNKEVKSTLKSELKQAKADLATEVKKTLNRKRLSDEQHRVNLERKIKERLPGVDSQSVLSVLLSNFISESSADSEE